MAPFKSDRAWRVYYTPALWHCGRTIEEAARLPDGVLVVVAYETKPWARTPYRRILYNSDWYFWSGEVIGKLGDVSSSDQSDTPDEWLSPDPILAKYPDAIIKKGSTTNDADFQAVMRLALKAESPP